MVEVVPVHGSGDKQTGWFVDFYNQWPAILRPRQHNWQDFNLTLFSVVGENSPYKRSWEVSLGLLGFTVTLTYVYRESSDNG